eukprot:TRINITY_DN5153_c0_g1_i1.p1 TRINITY_DN5153_c0_g1~~TRINITY_DN5153_c0_g1_i1.p1  ORF type:complete len:847 (-),score=260.45 TRINITY_DN5153_c0_g1_i1:14-2554(-)
MSNLKKKGTPKTIPESPLAPTIPHIVIIIFFIVIFCLLALSQTNKQTIPINTINSHIKTQNTINTNKILQNKINNEIQQNKQKSQQNPVKAASGSIKEQDVGEKKINEQGDAPDVNIIENQGEDNSHLNINNDIIIGENDLEEIDEHLNILAEMPTEIDGELSEMPYEVVGEVPILYWSPDKPFADECIRNATPVVLRNTSVTKWDAMTKWRMGYFKEKVSKIKARRMTKSFVNYEDTNPLEELYSLDSGFWPNSNESSTLLVLDNEVFFDEVVNLTDGHVISSAFQVPIKLLPDIHPRRNLRIKDKDFVYFSVWIGESGACTAAHIDPDENFYVQIYGEKEFILFPPENHRNFHMYPKASPNHKQVMVWNDLYNISAYRRRLDRPKPQGVRIVLQPGDMLYLPSYWFHHVVARETPPERSDTGKSIPYSISVNFWSTAFFEATTLAQIPGPFDEEFKGNNMYIWNSFPGRFTERDVYERTKVFTTLFVLMKLYGDNYIEELYDLYNTRFLPLFGVPNYEENHICGKKVTQQEFYLIQENFGPWVDHHVKALQTAPDGPIRQLEVWNWVELQLAYPSRNIHLPSYIINCLTFSNLVYAVGESPGDSQPDFVGTSDNLNFETENLDNYGEIEEPSLDENFQNVDTDPQPQQTNEGGYNSADDNYYNNIANVNTQQQQQQTTPPQKSSLKSKKSVVKGNNLKSKSNEVKIINNEQPATVTVEVPKEIAETKPSPPKSNINTKTKENKENFEKVNIETKPSPPKSSPPPKSGVVPPNKSPKSSPKQPSSTSTTNEEKINSDPPKNKSPPPNKSKAPSKSPATPNKSSPLKSSQSRIPSNTTPLKRSATK